jgi:dipeptidyl-peptidase III
MSQYLADSPPTVVYLAIKPHFEALTPKEQLYAHWVSRGAFEGTRITLRQVSIESEAIFDLILDLYKSENGDWKKVQSKAAVSDEDLKGFLEYAGQFLGNVGNYKSL